MDRAILQPPSDKIIEVPSPLGRIADPLSNDWDFHHKGSLDADDVRFSYLSSSSLLFFSRFNLFGNELAQAIGDCNRAGNEFLSLLILNLVLVDYIKKGLGTIDEYAENIAEVGCQFLITICWFVGLHSSRCYGRQCETRA